MASYTVNYDDRRFTDVENERQNQLNQYNKTYDDLINERNAFTQQQQDYVNNWQTTQERIANDNLNHQIELYNQQKDKAEKEYQKEARASYADYQKEVDRYGVSRENVVANGLSNSGYAESSKVDMYNAYQNRLANARSSLNDIKLEFDNAIKEATLQNNATLAENALTALKQKLDIALEGFNYKDTQTQNKLNWQYNINNNYYDRYKDVENQINYENQQAEAIRQYNEQQAYKEQQAKLAQEQWEKEYALRQAQFEYQKQQDAIANAQRTYSSSSSSGGGGYSSGSEYYLTDSTSNNGGSTSNNNSSNKNNSGGNTYASIAQSQGWTKTPMSMPQSNTTASAKKYGTFSNGYQPKGINGYGKVSKSGYTCTVNGREQNIWLTTGDGKTRAWYWDGSSKAYVGISW